jgi:importin subunit alpha-6/7
LTNVASGNKEHVQALLDNKVLDVFIKHLRSPHQEIIEQVIWGLGNISGDGPGARDIVLTSGAA